MGENGNAYKVLIEYLGGRAFGRPRSGWFGWKYEIAVDIKNVDCVPVAWDNGVEVEL